MTHIVSSLPGRIRVRDARLRNADRLRGLHEKLAGLDGVLSCESNAKSGSLLLHFAAEQVDLAAFEAQIDALVDAELARPQLVSGRRPLKMRVNRYAKLGMIAGLGSSLALVGMGSKRGHAAAGAVFVACLGVHLSTHRRHILR
ncbi:HMA2 domain-containing protein [Pseudomonas schmalbachii]|uniref:Cation transporter n=1 Tax=Pseudomonas schmalbachii TaxID=2816993 RepID=A0ABS3TJR6_9PSED|nr:hypothetical protein [Pseudomonas schmalbachii]MBO3273909.1 hypothetical protein [Pseudomonas schmalbachii]